jgi:ElaB/YqjD/DUF883 family membrane-anchored ribosome-binding protein
MAQVPSASNNKIKSGADEIADRIDAAASASSSANSPATGSDVQAEIANLRSDIAALTQTVASFSSGKIRQAGETSQQYMDTARETIANAEEDLEAYVRAKPLQSLAMAAGVGYVLALLSRR